MKKTRTRIAAAATVLGLAGLTGAALSVGGRQASPLADKPIVHTRVIRRTIHITRQRRPRRPAPSRDVVAAPAAAAPAASRYQAAAEPVTTSTSGAGAEAAPEYTPVTTGTSGTGAGAEAGPAYESEGGEHESEGGLDD